jgi:assimilatory nitrate reductase catalytic subunit
MAPVQWPIGEGAQSKQRFFAEGGFFANDQKARFVAPEIPAPRTETTAGRPLRLNTGRIRDQWHTMTRSGLSSRLGQHLPEPFVEVHPDDAARTGAIDGGLARVTTDYGQCVLRVVVSDRQQRGMLFAPIHWSEAPRRPRASARWWRPSPIRFPASPRTRRRRRRSRLMNLSFAASRCRG